MVEPEGEPPKSLTVRDMTHEDEYFVGTCSHEGESGEMDECAADRLKWIKERIPKGLKVKVALADGKHAGFLHLMPIEISPSGPVGREMSVMPCLYVLKRAGGWGIGKALVEDAERDARAVGSKALVVEAYYHEFWFMPAPFFEKCGFSVAKRSGHRALLWKKFEEDAEPPDWVAEEHSFEPAKNKVVVELYWNGFCQTSSIEARRVREVVAEFGARALLVEHEIGDMEDLSKHKIPRGIFVNGTEIGWGYEAPKEGIRDAISKALQRLRS
jgi:GNAT superfamily N-acetyltransferase